jgi:non-canonical (house-cleaning) NTP pyrophosphatase
MVSKLIPSIFLAGASLLLADVQYEQTSKVTGGSIANLPFVGGKIKEPQTTKHIYSGNRMAVLTKDSTSVYDLDKETVTTIHKEKREYSVMTFAEMREAMDKAMQKMQQATQKNDAPEMTWTVKVEDGGETKNINGFDAKKFVVTVDGVTTDKKSGKAMGSRIEMDSWVAQGVPGADEMNAFGKKMADKLGVGRATGMAPMVQAQMGKGWYEAAKEFAKMEGFNVMTVTRMSSTIDGKVMMVPEGQQNGPQINPGEVAKEAATNEAMSRLGGRLGGIGSGLGGLRRKKSSSEEAKPAAADSGKMVPATTMEMNMEITSISRAAADAAEMAVPAGFKQVEAELKKLAK